MWVCSHGLAFGREEGKYHMKQLQCWETGLRLGPSGAEVVENDSRLFAKKSCADIIGFYFCLCCGQAG